MTKENKPVVLEKHGSQNEVEPTLRPILAFLIRQCFKTGIELIVFQPNITPFFEKTLIATLSEAMKSAILEIIVCELRFLPIKFAFWQSRTTMITAQLPKIFFEKNFTIPNA